MIKAGDIIRCRHCGELLEVEENDLQVRIGYPYSAIVIECPVCGRDAYIDGVVKNMF